MIKLILYLYLYIIIENICRFVDLVCSV